MNHHIFAFPKLASLPWCINVDGANPKDLSSCIPWRQGLAMRRTDKQINEPVLLQLREPFRREEISTKSEIAVDLKHSYHGPVMNSV
jgi:hypothetical protein